jgi:hypothetical protein
MSFNVAGLSAYVKDNADKLIAATLLGTKTAKLIEQYGTVLTEVKSSEKIGLLETDATFQDGTVCGFSSSGSTVFSQRSVVTGSIKIEEELCLKTLEAKYTQKMLSAGAQYDKPEDFDFNQWWADRKIQKAALALETAIWQGDTASGDGQLNKFDGFIKQIVAASDEINANATPFVSAVVTVAGGGITETNVIECLQGIVRATPKQLKEADDFRVFVGYDVIEKANLALYTANKYHHDSNDDQEFMIPGTKVKAVGVGGLDATKGMFAIRMSNMYIGTDLLSDTTQVKVWHNHDEEKTRYRNAFRYGVNVAITSECVKFIPA